jgi:hypothetical protein
MSVLFRTNPESNLKRCRAGTSERGRFWCLDSRGPVTNLLWSITAVRTASRPPNYCLRPSRTAPWPLPFSSPNRGMAAFGTS